MAAALGLAFFGLRASWIAVAGGDRRTPSSAALGLAAPFGFLLRVGVLCCVKVGGDLRSPLPRCARPSRCARINLLRCACEMDSRSRGRRPNSLLHCARHGRCAWLSSVRRRAVLCRSQGRPPDPPCPLSSAWLLRSAWPSSARVRV